MNVVCSYKQGEMYAENNIAKSRYMAVSALLLVQKRFYPRLKVQLSSQKA